MMDRMLLRLTSAVACALLWPSFSSSARAQEGQFFTLKSKASDRCLHVKNGEKPPATVEVFDPCQTTPDFRVERIPSGDVLRIKVTPANFFCLQVKQPFRIQDLPVPVTPGNCVAPVSEWLVAFPDPSDKEDFRRVILRREGAEAPVCLQERDKSSELVVGLCTGTSTWKFTRVPPP